MSRFPLILLTGMIALSFPSAGAFSDDAPPPASPPSAPAQSGPGSEAEHQGDRTADLQREVSDLQYLATWIKEQLERREALKSGPTVGKQQDGQEQEDLDLQRHDSELRSQLQALIAQLKQHLQLYVQGPPIPDPAEQQQLQTVLDAFKQVIADLQQDHDKLQGLTARHHQTIAPTEAAAAPDIAEKQAARDAPERQAPDLLRQIADLQRQNADLQRQNDELRGQLAEQKRQHAQAVQDLVQRNADAARYKAERLRQDIDGLAPLAQQKMATVPARPGPKPPLQSRPTQLPPQSAPTPRPSRQLPVPSAAQGLQTARQPLAAGGQDAIAPPGAAGLVRAWSGYREGAPESGDLRSRP